VIVTAANVRPVEHPSIAKLINGTAKSSFGRLDHDAYRLSVNVLLKSGGERVIPRDPGNAGYTELVWSAAK